MHAPSSKYGVNQYTVPIMYRYCEKHRYELVVVEDNIHPCDKVFHYMAMKGDARPDYVCLVTNKVLMTGDGDIEDVLPPAGVVASGYEEMLASWCVPRPVRAWERNSIRALTSPCHSSHFVIIDINHTHTTSLLQSFKKTGFISHRYKLYTMPQNMMGTVSDWGTMSTSSAELGYQCALSDQIKEQYSNADGNFRKFDDIMDELRT